MLRIGAELLTLDTVQGILYGLKLVLPMYGNLPADEDRFLAKFARKLRQREACIASYPETSLGLGTIMLIDYSGLDLQLTVTAELALAVKDMLDESKRGMRLSDQSDSGLHLVKCADGSIEIASVRFFKARFGQQRTRRAHRAA